MQIETHLEYDAILASPTEAIHLGLRFRAPESGERRPRPIAFSLVLDRSGSMGGAALEHAQEAARMVVRHLRKEDLFSLTVFDDSALTLVPLGPVTDPDGVLSIIDRIDVGGCTNLTAGWMLGRDELKKAPPEVSRRLLLLSDGQLNHGVTDPGQVSQVVAHGYATHGIRTSALGFGDDYDEDLLSLLATSTSGGFYDASSPERLPAIFTAELDGLQQLVVQNLRVRLTPLMFCEGVILYGQYPWKHLDPKTVEITVGDLVSGEERTLVFGLNLTALPPGVDGTPLITLDEEELIRVEIAWESLTEQGISSKTWAQTIRARREQDPTRITLNEEMVPWIAAQQAAKTTREVIEAVDRGEIEEARRTLRRAVARLKAYPDRVDTADGVRLLRETLDRLEAENGLSSRGRKLTRASSIDFAEMSTARYGSTAEIMEELPTYKRRSSRRDAAEPAPEDTSRT
jgi:Ca-activated chloride channel homolog